MPILGGGIWRSAARQISPMLGTGGNDGRLDFTNNQMQRLAELLLPAGPGPHALVVNVHGGPISAYRNSWMATRATAVLVARGYAVFFTNPRGSTGYGRKFQRGIVNEWGGKDFIDIMSGVHAVVAASRIRSWPARCGAPSNPCTGSSTSPSTLESDTAPSGCPSTCTTFRRVPRPLYPLDRDAQFDPEASTFVATHAAG